MPTASFPGSESTPVSSTYPRIGLSRAHWSFTEWIVTASMLGAVSLLIYFEVRRIYFPLTELQESVASHGGVMDVIPNAYGQSLVRVDLHDRPIRDLSFLLCCRHYSFSGLDLSGTPLRDERLESLHRLMFVNVLRLDGTSVSDRGLRHLSGIHGLRELSLASTKITDEGLSTLAHCFELRDLDLSEAAITDMGLRALEQIPTLETLRVRGTQISAAGIDRLRAAKPALQIVGP